MSPMSAPERSRSTVRAGPSTLIAMPTIRKLTRYSRTECGTRGASVISAVGDAGAAGTTATGRYVAAARVGSAGAGEHRQQAHGVGVTLRALGQRVRLTHRPAELEQVVAGAAAVLVDGHRQQATERQQTGFLRARST